MMKNLSLIINAVLAAAIILLYVLFFTGKTKSDPGRTGENDSVSLAASGGIVYINIDTVLSKYDMYTDIQNELQVKLQASESQLAAKESAYRKAVEDYQYKISKQLVTRTEADELQQTIMKQEQDLYQLQNELRIKLSEEEQVAQRKVLNSIMEYLGTLEGHSSYQFILGTTFGGNILYANENLDITEDVIEGLNIYHKEQKKK